MKKLLLSLSLLFLWGCPHPSAVVHSEPFNELTIVNDWEGYYWRYNQHCYQGGDWKYGKCQACYQNLMLFKKDLDNLRAAVLNGGSAETQITMLQNDMDQVKKTCPKL